jgi:hypothetical protein
MAEAPFARTEIQMDLALFYRISEFARRGSFIVGKKGALQKLRGMGISLACNYLRCGCMNGRQSMHDHPFHDVGLAIWSSTSVTVLAGAYVLTGLVGVVMRPATRDVLSQVEPYLTILEVLMVLVAIALVVMMAALYSWAPAHAKTPALAALAFITIFAILTCGAHFVSLTVGRRIDERGTSVLVRQLSFAQWPTVALSIDLLAWDVFLGLSLLFVAPAFRGDRLQDLLRITMLTGGTLCLSGTLGPYLPTLEHTWYGQLDS